MKRMNFNVGDNMRKSKCQKMHVGKKHGKCHTLTANKKTMEDVSEIHYLGWET